MTANEINHKVLPQCQNRASNPVPKCGGDIRKFIADAGRFLCDEFRNHPRLRDLGFEFERLAADAERFAPQKGRQVDAAELPPAGCGDISARTLFD